MTDLQPCSPVRLPSPPAVPPDPAENCSRQTEDALEQAIRNFQTLEADYARRAEKAEAFLESSTDLTSSSRKTQAFLMRNEYRMAEKRLHRIVALLPLLPALAQKDPKRLLEAVRYAAGFEMEYYSRLPQDVPALLLQATHRSLWEYPGVQQAGWRDEAVLQLLPADVLLSIARHDILLYTNRYLCTKKIFWRSLCNRFAL